MLKTTVKLVYLIALPLLTTFSFNGRAAQAEGQPTQAHQLLSPCDYIPLKRQAQIDGQPVLVGTINGQTVKFMADTGATFSVLSSEIAKQFNLTLQSALLADGKPFVWKGKQGTTTLVSRFKISNVSFTKVPFHILPDQDFMLSPTAPDDTHFDGVVGENILRHFAVLVDASQHQFGLCLPGNLVAKQVADFGLTQPYVVPIAQKEDGRWYVEAQVTNEGTTANEAMALDTGANATQISDTTAQTLHLTITGQQQQVNSYRAHMVGRTSVGTLRLGDLTLSGTTVSVNPVSVNEPPILGMDVLSGYRVLIDFPGGKMYLQPNAPSVNITVKPQTPSVPVENAGH